MPCNSGRFKIAKFVQHTVEKGINCKSCEWHVTPEVVINTVCPLRVTRRAGANPSWRWGLRYSLDRSPEYHRANSESPINLNPVYMSLDCGRNLEHLVRIHTDTGRTCKLHTVTPHVQTTTPPCRPGSVRLSNTSLWGNSSCCRNPSCSNLSLHQCLPRSDFTFHAASSHSTFSATFKEQGNPSSHNSHFLYSTRHPVPTMAARLGFFFFFFPFSTKVAQQGGTCLCAVPNTHALGNNSTSSSRLDCEVRRAAAAPPACQFKCLGLFVFFHFAGRSEDHNISSRKRKKDASEEGVLAHYHFVSCFNPVWLTLTPVLNPVWCACPTVLPTMKRIQK